jgi:hypothetical protein
MNGREMERRDFANRLSASGVGRGAGGQGHGRWAWAVDGLGNPKFGLQAPRGRTGRAGQGRTSVEQDKHRAERAGQGRAEQSRLQPAASKQPATLKQLTAEGGDHRTTHLAHRSTCCSRTASRERASAEELESIEGLRVSVSLCLRVFTSSCLPALLHLCTASIGQGGPSSCHETSAACHPICPDHLVGTRILDEFDLFYLQNDKSKSYGFHVTARSSFPTAACQLPSSTFRDS